MTTQLQADLQEDFLCEKCGFTSPVPNDNCPECGSPMSGFGGPKAGAKPAGATEEKEEAFDDLSNVNESDDGSPLSLEALQEEENEDDRKSYEQDSYGSE